jgi:hypothetical protein
MEDAAAGEAVAGSFGDPEVGQAVPLAGAAFQAADVPAGRAADADENAVVAADGAGALDDAAAELARIAPSGFKQAAGAAEGEGGDCSGGRGLGGGLAPRGVGVMGCDRPGGGGGAQEG